MPLLVVLGVLSFGVMAAQSTSEEMVPEDARMMAPAPRAAAPVAPTLASLEANPDRACAVSGGVVQLHAAVPCQIGRVAGAVINP